MRKNEERKIALCYIRLSQTRDETDRNSPERQRANIQMVCDQYGWTPEWYEDVDGHKSGTKVKNRPGWLALETRLDNPDVVALVANDLARLHRKGWRIGNLLDLADKHGLHLVLASPGKQIDFSTAQGRFMAQLSAVFDEWYAVDIAQRAKDSVKYRKRKGVTIGIPPFGSKRNTDGYLEPSGEGAWLLTDGTWVAGDRDMMPDPSAIWRGYFECAEKILTLYAQNKYGFRKIAMMLHQEGWAFRNRKGQPKPLDSEAIRRVVSNWAEYGGHVSTKRARERDPETHHPDHIALNEARAVFSLDLLRTVGRVRHLRTTRKPIDDKKTIASNVYPLGGLVYCAHCEQLAQAQNNPKLRSRLVGIWANLGKPRYRHSGSRECTCQTRSIKANVLEAEFERLLQHLIIDENRMDAMTELAVQGSNILTQDENLEDVEAERRTAIARCTRRIEAARNLYLDGDLSREEYLRRKELNEREITHWEARNSELKQVTLELAMCLEALTRMAKIWKLGEPENKQGTASSIIEYIVYDLDTRRITDFRLKAWADRYIIIRSQFYEEEYKEKSHETMFQGKYTHIAPTGFEPVSPP